MNSFKLGPIRHLILLGASRIMPALKLWSEARGVPVTVITSPDQVSGLEPSLAPVVVSSLKTNAAQEAISRVKCHPHERLALSLSARWIVRKDFNRDFFGGNGLNAHGTRLPLDRGGGGFSWRILRQDRIGALALHLIDDGIDTGDLIAFEEYVMPVALVTPADMQQDYAARLQEFLIRTLTPVLEGEITYRRIAQPEHLSAYLPRIKTGIHGWIDWSWAPDEIVRFLHAFDIPFPGARTHCKNGVAILKRAQLHGGEVPAHPFQTGLILRNNGRWLVVALRSGWSLIVEEVLGEDGTNLIPSLPAGERFFTPPAMLEEAVANRVTIGPNG